MGNIISKINNFLFHKPDIDILLENYKYKLAIENLKCPRGNSSKGHKFFTTFYN